MLKVKLLHPDAIAPTVATPGEDIAYDLYALEDTDVPVGKLTTVRTGVAIEFVPKAGAIIKCRSSLARAGFSTEGGVIDAGYRGECVVMIRNHEQPYKFKRGDRIAQLLMYPYVINELKPVEVVVELSQSQRGDKGFGSSGR